MTKGELDRLRAEEKARARLVKFECVNQPMTEVTGLWKRSFGVAEASL